MAEEVQIDELSIAVEKSSDEASKTLKALASSLRSLNNACKKIDFSKTIVSLDKLTTSVKFIDGNLVSNIDGFTSALKNLAKVGTVKMSISKSSIAQLESLSNVFDDFNDVKTKRLSDLASSLSVFSGIGTPKINTSLSNQINNISKAASNIDESQCSKTEKLAESLELLSVALTDLSNVGKINVSIPKKVADQISGLSSAAESITESKLKRLSGLATSLNYLSEARTPKLSSSVSKQITNITDSLKGIDDTQLSKVGELANSLIPLTALGKPQLTSFITQLRKLPDVAREFNNVDFDKFILQIEKLADAMRPLADEMQKVANGFSAMPTKIQKFITSSEKASSSVKKSKNQWSGFFNTLTNGSSRSSSGLERLTKQLISVATIKTVATKIRSGIETANEYIESLNLFNVSMGKYAAEAQEYAELVGSSYGIDPAEFMKMEAVVMDMSKSFGVSTETAYKMSKALTQLTYDISSLYNLKIDEAATKVQSAIAGEIEPIRRLGKDLSVANLKLLATELGIQTNVDAMKQSEKAMLRTISLLRQSTSAMGDMSRTLEQPANQFRILKAQLTLLSRALGDLFLPLAQRALPYLTAFVKVSGQVVMAFANLAGFELPKFDYGESVESIESVGEAADDAAESVKKLYQLSFDELNILGSQSSSGVGSGISAEELAKLEAELDRLTKIENEAFSKELSNRTDEISAALTDWLTQGKGISVWAKDVRDKVLGIKDAVVSIGDSLGVWDIPEKIWNILNSMSLDVSKVGINFASSELDGVSGDDNLRGVLGNALGIALLTGAGLKLLSGGAAGLISYGLGIGLGILGLKMLFDDIGDAEADYSKENRLYTSFKKALSLSLMGVGLTLAAGKGLWHSLNTGFIIAGISLLYDGSNQEEQGEDEKLLDAFRTAAGLLLGGIGISGITTKEGKINLSGIGIALGIASASLIYNGAEMITEHDTRAEGFLAQAIGILLFGGAAAMVGSKWGMGIIAGVTGWAVSIPITVALDITLSLEKVKADKNGGFSQKLKSLIMPNDYLNIEGQLDTYLPYEDYGEIVSGGTSASEYIANSNRVDNELKSGALSKAESYVDEFMRGVDDGLTKKKLIPAYASGGIVEDGMFLANSRELVGRFSNGKTAVANNEQITEGIRRAVYDAFVAATGRSGRGGKIELILDKQVVGRAFGDAIDAEKRRSGANTKITFSNGGTR